MAADMAIELGDEQVDVVSWWAQVTQARVRAPRRTYPHRILQVSISKLARRPGLSSDF